MCDGHGWCGGYVDHRRQPPGVGLAHSFTTRARGPSVAPKVNVSASESVEDYELGKSRSDFCLLVFYSS